MLASQQNATTVARADTPAKAGAQLGTDALVEAAHRYIDLSNWAPASAGVAASGIVHQGGRT